jgi:hypothetical protein
LGGKFAGGDERVDGLKGIVNEVGVAPELGWDARAEGAGKTFGFIGGVGAVFPEDVRRADEPVLVQGIEGDWGAGEAEDGWSADEGDVVEIDDIEGLREDGAERALLEERMTGLLGK